MGELRARCLRGGIATALAATGARRGDDTLRRAVLALDSDLPPAPVLLAAAAQSAIALADLALAERLARAAAAAGGGFVPRLTLDPDRRRQLGHAIGTVALVGLLSLAGGLVLRGRVAWAGRWALAGALGSIVGLVLYVPILATAPRAIVGVTIALTFYLPVVTAVVFQARAVRGHVRAPKRWAAAWFFAILGGVAAAWFATGGVEGAAAGPVYPVFEKAAEYWCRMIPRSLLGGLVYGVWTALAIPLVRPGPHVRA